MGYHVKELSEMAGVSIRTLHHYDQIGLLRAQRDPDNGYRFYGEEEISRLQSILFYRELGFELKEIGALIERGSDNQVMEKHRRILIAKMKRLEKIINLIDDQEKGEIVMTKKAFDAFSMEEIDRHREKYRDEVNAKYDPTVVAESRKKTGKYSKEDWRRVMQAGVEIYSRLAELMDLDPGDQRVQTVIAAYQAYISENFYTCTDEIFKGLGELYIADERFTRNIDSHGDGLAAFLSRAIAEYYARL